MAFNFPDAPTLNQVYGAYTWDGEKWMLPIIASGGGGGLPEAPADHNTYGRNDLNWVVATPEAPLDSNIYGRKSSGWTQALPYLSPNFTGAMAVNGTAILGSQSSYNVIFNSDGLASIFVGGPTTVGSANFYRSAAHTFQNADGSGTFLSINSGGAQFNAVATGVTPTPPNDSSTKIPTTAFVQAAIAAGGNLPSGSTSGYLLQTTGVGSAAAWTGFLQAGTSAVMRTWQNKARDFVSVKDFGAVGNGSTNDTAAFQAAIAACAASNYGTVFVPSGKYLITSTLTLPHFVSLQGQGPSQTIITTNNSALNFVYIDGFYNRIQGIQFTFEVTPSNGVVLTITGNAFSHVIEDVHIERCWNGVVWQGSSNAARTSIGFVDGLKIWNFASIGMYFQYTNDIFVTNFLVYQKDIGTNSGTYGLYIADNCEAIVFVTGDIVGGQYSMMMNSATPDTASQRPAFNSFTNVYFDSSVYGSVINAGVETSFEGCWFSTGGFGGVASANSLTLNHCESMLFTNCRFFTAPLHGCLVTSVAKRSTFVNCSFTNNCVLAAAGNGHGLIIDSNVDGVEVIGGMSKNSESVGHQGYGIVIGGGATNITVYGVDVRGNALGGMAIGPALGNSVSVVDCKGYATQARGVGTIANTGANATISHGLAGAPKTVICTLLDTGTGPQPVGSGIPRVFSVTASTFVFDIGVAASGAKSFSWEAKL